MFSAKGAEKPFRPFLGKEIRNASFSIAEGIFQTIGSSLHRRLHRRHLLASLNE
jgi:hypothetical protein